MKKVGPKSGLETSNANDTHSLALPTQVLCGFLYCLQSAAVVQYYVSYVTCMWLNVGSKVRSFHRDKSMLKRMLEVDSACDAQTIEKEEQGH